MVEHGRHSEIERVLVRNEGLTNLSGLMIRSSFLRNLKDFLTIYGKERLDKALQC